MNKDLQKIFELAETKIIKQNPQNLLLADIEELNYLLLKKCAEYDGQHTKKHFITYQHQTLLEIIAIAVTLIKKRRS